MSPPLLALLWVAACRGPLPDPLAAQREALTALGPPAAGWAPQASLVLANSAPEEALRAALDGLMGQALAPLSGSFFGVSASIRPEVRVQKVTLSGSTACAGCLEMRVDLQGRALGRVENFTGSRELNLPYTSTLAAVIGLRFDGEALLARPEAVERWRVDLRWLDLPESLNQAVSGLFTSSIQDQLRAVQLPELPLIHVRGQTPVPVADVRVQPGAEAIVVDFAFQIPSAGRVLSVPRVEQGWAVVLPQETATGMLQAIGLGQPYDPNARATPEFLALRLDGQRFELDLRAWPTHGRNRPRDVQVLGRFGLTEAGALEVSSEEAVWLRQRGDPPDLVATLFGQRLLEGLAAAMSGATPATQEQSFAGVGLVASTREASAQGGVLLLRGDLTPRPAGTP